MDDTASLAFSDVKGGMNSADPPQAIAANQVASMVNCRLDDGYPATRHGVRVLPLSGDAAEFFALNNFQGGTFFNPSEGQGGIAFAASSSMLPVAVGGRKWIVTLSGARSASVGHLQEITAGQRTNSHLHTVWWGTAENYLLANDGQSNCWIWDSVNAAFFSTGYNISNKELSKVPNGGTVILYAHNRISVAINSRAILSGDSLHKSDQSSAVNLLNFTEQAYWATGQYFLPPTAMGPILAAANLPVQNTQHGHGESIYHCRGGIFSLDLNVYPRSKWSETPMVKTALKSCGATGPYALVVSDGDQYFRTRKGVQTLRSAAALKSTENPNQPISGEVGCWLDVDYPRWLRFASVALWDRGNRFFCTTSPVVHGAFRTHRGFVVRNMAISGTNPGQAPAWEGLWTLPPEMSGVQQFVNGVFDGEERQFAWVRGRDRRNRLVEFVLNLQHDEKEDGTRLDIPCQVITRAIDNGLSWKKQEWTRGRLYFKAIVGTVKWGVWFRTSEAGGWVYWRSGTATNEDAPVPPLLQGKKPRPLPIALGDLPKQSECGCKANEGRWIQFLIRWSGVATLENLRVSFGPKDVFDDGIADPSFKVTFGNSDGSEYDAFEYVNLEEPLWTQ